MPEYKVGISPYLLDADKDEQPQGSRTTRETTSPNGQKLPVIDPNKMEMYEWSNQESKIAV